MMHPPSILNSDCLLSVAVEYEAAGSTLSHSNDTQRQRAVDIILVLELNPNGQSQNHILVAGEAEWQIKNPDQKWRAYIKQVGLHNNM